MVVQNVWALTKNGTAHSILDSLNTSGSLTDGGTGDYTVALK
jgi:hypothetical protein